MTLSWLLNRLVLIGVVLTLVQACKTNWGL